MKGNDVGPTAGVSASLAVQPRTRLVLRDLAVRPDLVHDLVLADQLPGPCRKQAQHRPGTRTQGDDVATFVAQHFTGQIHGPVADNDGMLR